MKKILTLLVGLLLFLLLGYYCIYKFAAPSIEADIKRKVEGALIRNDLSSIKVETDGAVVILKGIVGSDEQHAKALRVSAVEGHQLISDHINIVADLPRAKPAVIEPYEMAIGLKQNKSLVLSGDVPNAEVKSKLLNLAKRRYGRANVSDDLSIRAKSPKNWEDALLSGMNVFEWMEQGQLDLSGEDLTLSGKTDTADSRQLINEYLQENLPTNYSGNLDISVTSSDSEAAATSAKMAENTVQPSPAEQAKAARNCQREFKSILSKKKIRFKTGMAQIDPSSTKLLDRLLAVAEGCSRQVLIIAGHTDSKGSQKANKALSKKRAQAVANYLQSKGIDKNKLIVRGYGEEKPTATNRTSKGRALNRRIEFTVKGVK